MGKEVKERNLMVLGLILLNPFLFSTHGENMGDKDSSGMPHSSKSQWVSQKRVHSLSPPISTLCFLCSRIISARAVFTEPREEGGLAKTLSFLFFLVPHIFSVRYTQKFAHLQRAEKTLTTQKEEGENG